MCEAKPGLRCATDTRAVAVNAAQTYEATHPGGPAVHALASAEATFKAQAPAAATAAAEPLTMAFARRRQAAAQFGAAFGQDIEPHGRYMVTRAPSFDYSPDEYETGEVTFTKPLRTEFGGGYDEPDNWKRRLSAQYGGKTGRDLSNALLNDGYDGIVTHDKYGVQEVVDLTQMAEARTWTTPRDVQQGLEARHPGLSLSLSKSGDYVVLSKIVVPKDARGGGLGTRVMADIVETADRNGWPLALTPSSDFGGSKTRLEKFYRRFGFVPNKGRAKDYATRETFLRPPPQ